MTVSSRAAGAADNSDSQKIAVAAGVRNADFKTATYVDLGRIARPTITMAKMAKSWARERIYMPIGLVADGLNTTGCLCDFMPPQSARRIFAK